MEEKFRLFPIQNPEDFEIRSSEDYKSFIYSIAAQTVNLEVEFPDSQVLVVYEV